MSPGSSTDSHPAFAHIGLRETPRKNHNQVTYPDRDSNPGHLVSRPDALAVTPQVWTKGTILSAILNEHITNANHTYRDINTDIEILHIQPKSQKLNTLEQYELYRHTKTHPNDILNTQLNFKTHTLFDSTLGTHPHRKQEAPRPTTTVPKITENRSKHVNKCERPKTILTKLEQRSWIKIEVTRGRSAQECFQGLREHVAMQRCHIAQWHDGLKRKTRTTGTSTVLTRYDPCNYDLFTKVKEPLRGTRYNTRDELIRALGWSIRNINKDGPADGVRRLPNIWQKTVPPPAHDVVLQPPQIDGICSQFMWLNLLHPQPEDHAAIDFTMHQGAIYPRELHSPKLT
ncbi:hypothetical protein ANN_16443 [Periplaneta americana]|uniref:Uncharacterized protein n=1 Tax=Periplaneta americana TaxID=6978 RepID=A0ABQ8SJF0_PERAM|nr:hypothetical protein ANN_16443 [Periplaneta americana]